MNLDYDDVIETNDPLRIVKWLLVIIAGIILGWLVINPTMRLIDNIQYLFTYQFSQGEYFPLSPWYKEYRFFNCPIVPLERYQLETTTPTSEVGDRIGLIFKDFYFDQQPATIIVHYDSSLSLVHVPSTADSNPTCNETTCVVTLKQYHDYGYSQCPSRLDNVTFTSSTPGTKMFTFDFFEPDGTITSLQASTIVNEKVQPNSYSTIPESQTLEQSTATDSTDDQSQEYFNGLEMNIYPDSMIPYTEFYEFALKDGTVLNIRAVYPNTNIPIVNTTSCVVHDHQCQVTYLFDSDSAKTDPGQYIQIISFFGPDDQSVGVRFIRTTIFPPKTD